MRRYWSDILAATAVVIVVGVLALWPEGVEATVRNADVAVMRDVQVVVTGRSYALGDLQANDVRSVRVKPTGRSNIEIRYIDLSGTLRIVAVDCDIEDGTSGSISVDVANGAVTRKTDDSAAPL